MSNYITEDQIQERSSLAAQFARSEFYQQYLLPWLVEEREMVRDILEIPPTEHQKTFLVGFAIDQAEQRGRVLLIRELISELQSWINQGKDQRNESGENSKEE